MTGRTFPDGIFIGTHRGVKMYTNRGQIRFLLGWIPHTRASIRAAKIAITKWSKQ